MSEPLGPDVQFPLVIADLPESSALTLEFIRHGWCARRVRGQKMGTVDELFDEFSAALQFPWYFGENWPAFDECINDLEWLEWRKGFAIIIAEADLVLHRDSAEQLGYLIEVLQDAICRWVDIERNQWAKPEPINNAEPTTMPFRIMLQVGQSNYLKFRERWEVAGAVLWALDPSSWRTSGILKPHVDR